MWEWNIRDGEDYWSPQSKKLIGYRDDEIEASFEKWEALLHPDDRQSPLNILNNHLEENEVFNQEFRLRTKAGDYRWFCSRGQALWDAGGNAIRVVGSIRDITDIKHLELELKEAYQNLEEKVKTRTAELRTANRELKKIIDKQEKAEAALRKATAFTDNLIDSSLDCIVVADISGCLTRVNNYFLKLLGYERKEEVLGKHIMEFGPKKNTPYELTTGEKVQLSDEYFEGRRAMYTHFVKKRRISNWQNYFVTREGKLVPVEHNLSFLYSETGDPIATFGIVRDITERRRAEQKIIDYQNQLKALTSQLTLSEEKERKRFAEYLHDEIGQYLFASQIQLEQLKTSLVSSENTETLENIISNIRKVIENARSLTFELSSPILHELGLEKALEWLAEYMCKQWNLRVALNDDRTEKPLNDDVKIFLYQAVRELLTNVAKHAQTTGAVVSIEKDNSNIQIRVEDGGIGFNATGSAPKNTHHRGFGLMNGQSNSAVI